MVLSPFILSPQVFTPLILSPFVLNPVSSLIIILYLLSINSSFSVDPHSYGRISPHSLSIRPISNHSLSSSSLRCCSIPLCPQSIDRIQIDCIRSCSIPLMALLNVSIIFSNLHPFLSLVCNTPRSYYSIIDSLSQSGPFIPFCHISSLSTCILSLSCCQNSESVDSANKCVLSLYWCPFHVRYLSFLHQISGRKTKLVYIPE